MAGAGRSSPSTPETRRERGLSAPREPHRPSPRSWREERSPTAAGAQNLHLPSAVPLTSPFELQHQIFREHPAPEQLFLIATSQHCCLCLYINIYSVPRTEHQSPALPRSPRPGRSPPRPNGPHCCPTELGWAPPPDARTPQRCREKREATSMLSSPDAPLPTSGSTRWPREGPCWAWTDPTAHLEAVGHAQREAVVMVWRG